MPDQWKPAPATRTSACSSLAMAASALTTSAAAAGAATPAAGGAAVAAAGVTVSRPVSALVASKKTREGAGFIVRRPLGGGTGVFDPFLMLDHFGPVSAAPRAGLLCCRVLLVLIEIGVSAPALSPAGDVQARRGSGRS